jgi:hypothetical protein
LCLYIGSDYCSQREDPFNIKKEKVLLKIAHLKTDAKNTFFVAKKLSNGEKYLDESYENLKIIMLNNEISEKLICSLLSYS